MACVVVRSRMGEGGREGRAVGERDGVNGQAQGQQGRTG